MSRRLLQIINGAIALLTLALGGMQLAFGVKSPVYAGADIASFPLLDSNLRFFGGMGFGLGLVLLWTIPRIERRTMIYRVVWFCAFLGGMGRLISWVEVGAPSTMMVVFAALEVVGAPLLVLWQHRVSMTMQMKTKA